MASGYNQSVFNYLKELTSFPDARIKEAMVNCGNNKERALNMLLESGPSEEQKMIQDSLDNNYHQPEDSIYGKGDDELHQAIQNSMKDQLTPEQTMRDEGIPVGLKNVGNTCYVNSLFQTYFMIPQFVKEVLNFCETKSKSGQIAHPLANSGANDESGRERRQKASVELILQLGRLFGYMMRSNRKYVDPTQVLRELVDEYGNRIMIGDQKDVGEFNINLLDRVEEGFKSLKKSDVSHPLEDREEHKRDVNVELKSETSINSSVSAVQDLSESAKNPEEEDNIMVSMFSGKMKEIIKFKEVNEEVSQNESTVPFGQIILDISHKDLNSSWDEQYRSQIENYKTPKNFTTTADRECWVTDLPHIFLFQLQRVVFDTTTGIPIKLNSPFHFEKVIYADRFLEMNKETALKIRDEVNNLKRQKRQLEEALVKFEGYLNESMPLDDMLGHVTDFLGNQLNSEGVDKSSTANALTVFDPDKLGPMGLKPKEVNGLIDVIKAYKSEVTEQIRSMQEQRKRLNNDIEQSYASLTNKPYRLHAVLVHDGKAGSGHYWSFIRDPKEDVWFRYNDTQVTKVDEEIVMKESIGGWNQTSAYCLVYLDDHLLQEASVLSGTKNLRSYALSSGAASSDDFYGTMLPRYLKDEVANDNVALMHEIEEGKTEAIVKQIHELYKPRYQICQKYPCREHQNLKAEQLNFPIYVHATKSPELGKWWVLDLCTTEVTGESLVTIGQDSTLGRKISEQIINKDGPKQLLPGLSDMNLLNELKQKFAVFSGNIVLVLKAINHFNHEEEWVQGWRTVSYIRKLKAMSWNGYYINLPNDLNRVIFLRACSEVNFLAKANKWTDALRLAKLIAYFSITNIDQTDPHRRQVLANLRNGFTSAPFPEEHQEVIAQIQKTVDTYQPSFDISDLGEKLDDQQEFEMLEKNAASSPDIYGWIEGWKVGSQKKLEEAIGQFKDKYKGWVEMHTMITEKKIPLTKEHVDAREAEYLRDKNHQIV